MDFIYTSNNGWRIGAQEDLFSSSIAYTIYRLYPNEGWQPYKFMGNSLLWCFIWLFECRFISYDEAVYQYKLLTNQE